MDREAEECESGKDEKSKRKKDEGSDSKEDYKAELRRRIENNWKSGVYGAFKKEG